MASRPHRTLGAAVAALCALSLGAGCATTDVSMSSEYAGALPRPQQVLVFPFATSPEEVQLDWSPTVIGAWKLQGLTSSEEQQKVGHAVAQALATHLAQKVQALGLPAQVVSGDVPTPAGPTLTVTGQFLSIDEGNRAERVAIGLGAGRSDVRTAVQVSEVFPDSRRLVEQFDVDAKSGRKPGAAETMGMGAAAGDLAVSAAVTAAGSVASEAFGTDVDADAERTAAKIASLLGAFFQRQGWIAAAN